jgi:uncharacterized protein YciI
MTDLTGRAQPPLPRPEDLETFYVSFLFPGPDYSDDSMDDEAQRSLLQMHVSHVWSSQHGDGPAIAGGPLVADEEPELPVGMSILRANSLAEAQHLAAIDPAVVTGHFRSVVLPWLVAPNRFASRRPFGN